MPAPVREILYAWALGVLMPYGQTPEGWKALFTETGKQN